jgi:aspartate dehydrogenase
MSPRTSEGSAVRRLGIIGGGKIGRRLAARAASVPGWAPASILSRDSDLDAFLAARPELVFECASREALAELGPRVLRAGCDLVPLSLTAFCDPAVERELRDAAEAGPGRIEIPPGAAGALDALAAAREDELRAVVYRQIKSPAMWKTTPAGDVGTGGERRVFRAGTAREIARHFPHNLNTAVGVALAGLGLDATQVELVADPAIHATLHEIEIDAGPGSYSVRVGGRAVGPGGDPADYSTFGLLRILRRRAARMAV